MKKFMLGLAVLFASSLAYGASVVEFYNTNLDHYFITAEPAEQAAVDAGDAGPGWSRTGNSFKAGGPSAVCRFYGSVSPGPNSHFYTVNMTECDGLKQLALKTSPATPRWNFESLDFATTAPVGGVCASGLVPVYRAYNNGNTRGIDSNHRITTSLAAIAEVVAKGWVSEGVVMCASPPCAAPQVWNGVVCIYPMGIKVTDPQPVPAGCTDAGMQCWKDAVANGTVKFIATSAMDSRNRPVMFGYFINGGGDSPFSGPNSAKLFWADTGEPMFPSSVSSGFGLQILWVQGNANGLFLQLADGTCGQTHWMPPSTLPGVESSVWTNTLVPCQ